MQSTQHQVSCFRRGDCERDRFQVTHLTNHDYVRVFPERAAQGRAERTRVGPDLALRYMAAFRLEDVFNRIFKGDDMLMPLQVNLLNQRGECGGLSAAN